MNTEKSEKKQIEWKYEWEKQADWMKDWELEALYSNYTGIL